MSVKAAIVAALVVAALSAPQPASAYSVLAHEANIDGLWDSTIAPMLRARFPEASSAHLQEARGYAYGGCVIQDLGYYPLGSHFFSNLLHYVRTGDFLVALIHDAQDVDEYAFALGALGHYSADNKGHPQAHRDVDSWPTATDAQRKRLSKIRQQLAVLEAAPASR